MGEPRLSLSCSFPRQLLSADTEAAARSLIGARLARGRGAEAAIGRIVEVEAYAGLDDLASHARFGRTGRNAVMFGPPGVAYVYLVYGMHHCLNVVTEPEGRAAALLIRAVEPVQGEDRMRAARLRWTRGRASRYAGTSDEAASLRIEALPPNRLASGPGLVCAAFSIGRHDDGSDLCEPASDLRLEIAAEDEPLPVATGPRVGIDYAPEPWLSCPWRFFVPGNASLSVVVPPARRRVAS
jgi:DNA-3-methyladenine glycosylase